MHEFIRNHRGQIIANITNLKTALEDATFCGSFFARSLAGKGAVLVSIDREHWRYFTNNRCTEVRILLEKRGFTPVGKGLVDDVAKYIAVEYVPSNKILDE